MTEKFQITEVMLSNGTTFEIIHNLPNLGLDVDVALESWINRTDLFTSQDFCDYLKSKNPQNVIALPKTVFDKLFHHTD